MNTNLIYSGYFRKSNEAKERQEYSIPDQKKEYKEYLAFQNIYVSPKFEFEDEKTAFIPHKRTGFDELLRLTKEGKINAWVTWKENRLCRNPEEGGVILQLLQDGIIKEIRVISSNTLYTPDSDHLILQIHFGMANQFSRNLSKDVKRGLYRKASERHEYPRPAPIGYESFGEIGKRQMRPDPLRASFIEKAFKLAATGVYSYGHIANILHDEGFTTKKEKKVSKAHIEIILKRPTYYGFFYHNGELFEGNYESIISKALFDLVQDKLQDRSKPKKVGWVREFVRLIKCGNCGCAITTTIKKKYIKKEKAWKDFIYHHCTHRRNNCKEKPLTDAELKAILFPQVERILIDKETWQLGLALVKEKYAKELEKNKNQHFFYSLEQQRIRDKLQKTIDMRTNGELTKDEFMEQKNKIMDQLAQFENKTKDTNYSLKTWLEQMEEYLNTAFQIQEILEHGKPEQKQNVLAKIGENFILQGEKLTFSFKKPYDVLLQPEARQSVLASFPSGGTRSCLVCSRPTKSSKNLDILYQMVRFP